MIGVRKYGWRPDIPDLRDYKYKTYFKLLTELPKKVDLRSGCSKIENQGSLGSCTANALVGLTEYLEIKKSLPYIDFSRLFIYYNERALEGTIRYDSGTTLRSGVKTLVKKGACSETSWPYKISKYKKRPSCKFYKEGKKHQAISYERLETLNEMKSCLAEGFPFVFGFSVYDSFETWQVSTNGIVPMPSPGESCLGGHAVMAVGYDDNTQRFIVRNSWGEGWGDKGYFYMPYEYLTNRDLSDDFWTIRDIETGK